MSGTSKTPFTMVGSADATACVDGVCGVPVVQESAADAARDVQTAAAASALAAAKASHEVDSQA